VAHPTSYTMDTWSLQGVKRPERGVYQQHPSSAEVKERIELYLYFLMGLRGFFKGDLYLYRVGIKYSTKPRTSNDHEARQIICVTQISRFQRRCKLHCK